MTFRSYRKTLKIQYLSHLWEYFENFNSFTSILKIFFNAIVSNGPIDSMKHVYCIFCYLFYVSMTNNSQRQTIIAGKSIFLNISDYISFQVFKA